jgi:hypothetical protein
MFHDSFHAREARLRNGRRTIKHGRSPLVAKCLPIVCVVVEIQRCRRLKLQAKTNRARKSDSDLNHTVSGNSVRTLGSSDH